MRQWLTNLRKKLWLTRKEQWANGWGYARQTIYDYGYDKGLDILWNNPRDYGHPFDQGIFDYIDQIRGQNGIR